LTTFTNPTPAGLDDFGWRVAAVGSSRVLICAERDDTGALNSGTAYLFSTNGTLLTTFTNPTPAASDWFGVSVAAVGSDQVLIGAMWDDTGATDAGAAYLFALPYPPLSIARNAATVSVKWVTPETGLALQQAGALSTSTVWSNTSDSVSISGLTNVVQQTITTKPLLPPPPPLIVRLISVEASFEVKSGLPSLRNERQGSVFNQCRSA
jgi:hypothetical protein